METVAANSSVSVAGPRAFWGDFLALVLTVSEALDGAMLQKVESGKWNLLAADTWPEGLAAFEREALDDLANAAVLAEDAFAAFPNDAQPRGHLLAFCAMREAGSAVVVILRAACTSPDAARAILLRLKAFKAVIETFRLREQLTASEQRLANFCGVLDLLTLLNAESHFGSASMLLCNEIAARFQAERVSLGWLRSGRMQLRAISHAERFERKMNVVTALESAMEEATEQDDEIVLPGTGSTLICRDHERYAQLENLSAIATIPLRTSEGPAGAMLLERASHPFEAAELQTLRLFWDQATPRLSELEMRSRWFLVRWANSIRKSAGHMFGWDHTWLKLTAAGVLLLFVSLLVVKKTYRVEAPFTLQSDEEAQLPAPFDGYIEKVLVRPGDIVEAGGILVELDTRELRLEEAAAAAEQTHFLSEAAQAQSESKLSEMLIAQAGAARAKARLDLARYRIEQAGIVAPISGAIVEGDLREKIGAPVKQGDLLMKIVKLSKLHIAVDIAEQELGPCAPGSVGELAFASRPQSRAAFRIEQIQPVAETREHGNVFVARAMPTVSPEDWWRPGMTGICKINGGRHSLLWILSHRTMDYFHMLFWW